MSEAKKTVSPQVHLQALALFTMAKQHYDEARRYEQGLGRLLGYEEEYLGHFSDALYGGRNESFEDAFRKAGLTIKEEAAA